MVILLETVRVPFFLGLFEIGNRAIAFVTGQSLGQHRTLIINICLLKRRCRTCQSI
jgi:hypothetical protein